MNLTNLISENWMRFRKSETGGRLSKAVVWGGIATILGRGLPVAGMMFTARVLGPSMFGKLTLLYSTAVAFGIFAVAGLGTTCTKFVADFHRKEPIRAGRLIDLANLVSAITALLIGGFIVSVGPWFARVVLAAPDLSGELYWCAALTVVLAFSSIQQGILIGYEAFRAVALIELVGGVAILILVPSGGMMYGIKGAFIGMGLGYGLKLIVQHLIVARQTSERGIPRRWTLPVSELPVLWQFSLPTMLNGLLWGPVTWISLAIVSHQTNGHAEVGIFNAANQWFSFLLFLPSIITQVSFPILSERLNAGATSAAWRLFYGKVLATMGIVTPIVLAIIALSPFIMAFYGPAYSQQGPVLIVVAIASWLAAPQGFIGNLFFAHAKPWSWFVASMVWAGCLLLTVAIFRDYGALALAWGNVAAYGVRGLFSLVQIYQLRAERWAFFGKLAEGE